METVYVMRPRDVVVSCDPLAGAVVSCAPIVDYFGLLHDAPRGAEQAWETFGTPSLPVYLSRGLDKFQETLEEFADISRPLAPGIDKQLPFMLESLLYVRHLIEEMGE
jgi:hypothetical protein